MEANMAVLNDHYELNNGALIPKLGFGTWQTPNVVAPAAVLTALRVGYTHIDTAEAYQNEGGVAEGLRRSGISRDKVFITTKVQAEFKSYGQAKAGIESSISLLGPVDLLLIHAPKPWPEMFTDTKKQYLDENVAVWMALEEAYESGDAKAIGVSNFSIDDIQNIIEHCSITPMVDQIRFHVGHTQDELVSYCQESGILVEAYSPIGTGRLLDNPAIVSVAEKVGHSVPQVCIRYDLQKGTLPLPKSVHDQYIEANTHVDFELSDEDMKTLDAITGL